MANSLHAGQNDLGSTPVEREWAAAPPLLKKQAMRPGNRAVETGGKLERLVRSD